jgi:hypothetical protein
MYGILACERKKDAMQQQRIKPDNSAYSTIKAAYGKEHR